MDKLLLVVSGIVLLAILGLVGYPIYEDIVSGDIFVCRNHIVSH